MHVDEQPDHVNSRAPLPSPLTGSLTAALESFPQRAETAAHPMPEIACVT
jgi:hypothetical protein